MSVGPPSADIGVRTPAALPKPHRWCRRLEWPPPPALPFWCQTPSRSHGHPGPRWFSLTQTPPQMRSLHTSSHLELHFSEDTEHPSALRTVKTPGAACEHVHSEDTAAHLIPGVSCDLSQEDLAEPEGWNSQSPGPVLHPPLRKPPPASGWTFREVGTFCELCSIRRRLCLPEPHLSCTRHSRTASSQGHC